MPRLPRKNQHIRLTLRQKPVPADFSEVQFVHNCIPERNLEEVTLRSTLLGQTLRSPLFINAVTGGTTLAGKINAALADVARRCSLPMALGSQMAALENPAVEMTFKVVRQVNPEGIIWANLGAYATPGQARRAVEMVSASALQIHLNVPQELVMCEGEHRFRGRLERIRKIAADLAVPVIVKEVGFGVAREQALALAGTGVAAIDVGGRGGTNFMAIENIRAGGKVSRELLSWGIPTAISLVEVLDAAGRSVDVIASGGMGSSLNIAKALSLGAKAIGLAGLPLYLLIKKGKQALIEKIRRLEHELRLVMLMAGASSLEELERVPLVITGGTAEWLQQRGIDPSLFAVRRTAGS